jgi:hypothetical protein
MTYVTPVYLLFILTWWGWQDALPLLQMKNVRPESVNYVLVSRGIIVLFAVVLAVLVKVAWKRNGYNDRAGLPEVPALEAIR